MSTTEAFKTESRSPKKKGIAQQTSNEENEKDFDEVLLEAGKALLTD